MDSLFNDAGRVVTNNRRPEYPVDPLFVHRWSPRAFDPTAISDHILKPLFEAARWSPSCYNEQPWLFMYATDKEHLSKFRSVLSEFNQNWTQKAPVLAFIMARRNFERDDTPNDWAVFDCGAAWMALALQARQLGLYAHAMAGFDQEKAYGILGINRDEYRIISAIAIGTYGDAKLLPEDMRTSEQPNDRKPLEKIAIKAC